MSTPVTSREFLRQLNKRDLAAMTRRTNRHGVVRLTVHLGLLGLAATATLVSSGGLYLAMALLTGVLLVFLFAAMHEASHRTAFRARGLNHLVTHLAGLLLVLPPRWFHHFHMAHHAHTQNPDLDPELATPKPSTFRGYLWHLTGLPVWMGQIKVLVRNSAGLNRDAFVPAGQRRAVQAEALTMVMIYTGVIAASVASGSWAGLYVWVIPALLGQPFLRAVLMAEHGGCGFGPDMLANSRTTLAGLPLRFLAWNMPFHAEHHSLPAVPFHQLPSLHRHTAPHITHLAGGYPEVHRQLTAELK